MKNPHKLTNTLIKTLCDYLSNGITRNIACKMCGISESTFKRWEDSGKEDFEAGKNTLLAKAYCDFQKAEGEFEYYHLNNIKDLSVKSWQASAWILERCIPERYSQNRKIDETSDDGVIVNINLTDTSIKPKDDGNDN